jgi:hypothetical protein
MAKGAVEPEPMAWARQCELLTLLPFNVGVATGANQARANTPIGVAGNLRNSWIQTSARFANDEYSASIFNRSDYAVYGIMGRGPGKFPPFGPNTPLAAWASKRGIVPFLVARSIAKKGTQRWRDKTNWVGFSTRKPNETTDDFEITSRRLQPGSAMRTAHDVIVAKFREVQFP